MCRWFAYVSPTEPCLLSDVLIEPANAISKQCSEHYLPQLLPHGSEHDLDDSTDKLMLMRNSLLNMDGMGVAWYTDACANYTKGVNGKRPAMYKSQSPPINDFNFRSLCNNTESHCVFAHIRASSGSVVTQVNSHPFIFGRQTFMHNGVVSDFTNIRRDLSDLPSYDAYCNVLGTTDSEHVAALYINNLTGGKKGDWERTYTVQQMRDALVKTIITILELQHEVLGDKAAPNSLNLCATDGTKMIATRFHNHATQQPPSLYWSESAGRTLDRKYPGSPDKAKATNPSATKTSEEHGKHTIVASEPTTYDEGEWHLIGKNCVLLVDEEGMETEEKIEYNAKTLDAVDPNNL